MFCKRCRYNLKLIESRACPECGRAFDPGNRKTFRKGVGWPRWLRRIFQGLIALCVVISIALGVIEWRYQREVAAAEALEQVGEFGAIVWWSKDAHLWAEGIPILHERLQHVDGLTLGDDQLAALPPELWQLTELKSLRLDVEQLRTLSPEIGQLTKLESLFLYSSQLNTLPPEIGNLTNLKNLILFRNGLTELPPEIGKLVNLTTLQIELNLLSTLPPEIRHLTKLTELLVHSGQLTVLPPEIGELTNLKWLNLSYNELSTLPPEMGRLPTLKRLDLNNNPIADNELERLKPLKNLQVLILQRTKVSRHAVAALQQALPNCEIKSDFNLEKP